MVTLGATLCLPVVDVVQSLQAPAELVEVDLLREPLWLAGGDVVVAVVAEQRRRLGLDVFPRHRMAHRALHVRHVLLVGKRDDLTLLRLLFGDDLLGDLAALVALRTLGDVVGAEVHICEARRSS